MPVHVPGHLSGIRCPPLFWRERAFLVRGKKTVVVDPASILFTQPLLINAHELHCAPVETPSSRVYFLLSERCDECERIRDDEMVSHLLAVFHVWSPISSSTHQFRRPCTRQISSPTVTGTRAATTPPWP